MSLMVGTDRSLSVDWVPRLDRCFLYKTGRIKEWAIAASFQEAHIVRKNQNSWASTCNAFTYKDLSVLQVSSTSVEWELQSLLNVDFGEH